MTHSSSRTKRSRYPSSDIPLPGPETRQGLRLTWGLTTSQVASAFGVTPSTVRSWEAGRAEPRGRRREQYARFLAGLTLEAPSPSRPTGPRGRTEPATAAAQHFRGPSSVCRPSPIVPVEPNAPVGAHHRAPVAPARVRRLRWCATAAGAWTAFLYLWLTVPLI
ncbi:helix-turn-helix domain-containing protein [Streptomyces sp. NPDC048111]|uniref:helix-turn-helix domain-containing protein n=1 Tax=Streptomyces sp. NPDC048111 TaxID=3365500 RepID=UPI00371EF0DB